MIRRLVLASAVLSSLGLVACGGSGGGDSTQTGVFVDSAVANIGYRTETKSGVTNSNGEFEYEQGETVTFFIGDLEFPPVAASGVLTPLDIAGTENSSDRQVVNIARLLQTLDSDGDASNGITIPEGASESASAVDFDVSVLEFEANASVINLVANSGAVNTVLISAESALSHLEGTLEELESEGGSNPSSSTPTILGTWYAEQNLSGVYMEFNTDGTYNFAQEYTERGNYTLEGQTISFDYTESNYSGGAGIQNITGAEVSDDNTQLTFELNGEFKVFSRFSDSTTQDSNAKYLTGIWVKDYEDGNFVTVIFNDDHSFIVLSTNEDVENYYESGTYSLNEEGLAVSIERDASNTYGFSAFESIDVSREGSTLTLTVTGDFDGEQDIVLTKY